MTPVVLRRFRIIKVANLVHFVKCKPPKVTRTWMEEGLLLLCQFVVTFHADEVLEKMMPILIDLQTLADLTHLRTALDNHWSTIGDEDIHAVKREDQVSEAITNGDATRTIFNSPSGVHHPMSTPFRLTDGLTWALHTLEPQIEREIATIRSANRAQLQDELAKSEHYYETTLRKLEKQLNGTLDVDKRERLLQKIEATKLDRHHRMEDISRAYDVSADVRLDQATLYRVPVACVEAQLQQRTDLFRYVFRYHTWASAWSPITCPVCHEQSTRLERGADSWHCGCQRAAASVAPATNL